MNNFIIEKESILRTQIAGISYFIWGYRGKEIRQDIWNIFKSEKKKNPEIKLHVLSQSSVEYQIEEYVIPKGEWKIFRYESEVLLANKSWNDCYLIEPREFTSFVIFTNHIFYSRAIYHKMIQCHSSLVDWNGSGILFLGPSGIGKTTQAERWAKYRGADIINGDLVFVQQTDDGFLGWGTPWHGSSPYCINRAVPLKALVVLKQSKENRIRELTGFEKVSEVSNNVFYPTWLDDGMELCTEILNNLLLKLPVYRLDNRADEEAVELVEQAIQCIDK